jgi:D-alanyl-D-alanine carboxypeptidase/D-alanyl-D-alanine-endopeptidase (penicillin-binding protein 4)
MMVRLLARLWADPLHAARFQSTLPVAGASGTLANRMRGTPAEGRVRAKTGTMSHVRSLAGYLTTVAGEDIAFAMIANDFQAPGGDIDAVMDRALTRIVELER